MNLLLPTEAAHKLRISRAKFYQMIKKGQVQPYNVGGKTVFKEEELEALVEKGAGRKRKVPAEVPVELSVVGEGADAPSLTKSV